MEKAVSDEAVDEIEPKAIKEETENDEELLEAAPSQIREVIVDPPKKVGSLISEQPMTAMTALSSAEPDLRPSPRPGQDGPEVLSGTQVQLQGITARESWGLRSSDYLSESAARKVQTPSKNRGMNILNIY